MSETPATPVPRTSKRLMCPIVMLSMVSLKKKVGGLPQLLATQSLASCCFLSNRLLIRAPTFTFARTGIARQLISITPDDETRGSVLGCFQSSDQRCHHEGVWAILLRQRSAFRRPSAESWMFLNHGLDDGKESKACASPISFGLGMRLEMIVRHCES